MTSRYKRALARFVANGEIKTAVEATRAIYLEREDQTLSVAVRQALKEQGLKAIKKAEKPKLYLTLK